MNIIKKGFLLSTIAPKTILNKKEIIYLSSILKEGLMEDMSKTSGKEIKWLALVKAEKK